MEFLKAQASQIGQQLRGMTASQRIAVVLLLIVLMGGMWGLLNWSGQAQWGALLDQSFTPEQLQRVQAELAAAGVESKVEGDRIMVKGDDDRRRQTIAVLAQRGALPRDTSMGYTALIKDNSVFMGDRSRMWMESRGLETELSGVLRRFQGVHDAHVFIEVPQQRTFGGKSSTSRASVHVTLGEGESLDKHRIMAIANFVTGAVSGLDPKDVKITDGVRYYRVPDVTGELPTELLDVQRQAEEHHAQKIYDQLRYIPGVLVNVHATLQTSEEQIQEKKLGPAVVDQETSRTEEMSGASGASAPGVRPNQGRVLAESGGGSSNSREESDTSLKGERDAKLQTTLKKAGVVEKLTASVNVPRSYLERILGAKGEAKNAVSPKDIDKLAETELPKIRALVKPLINAATDEQVVVNYYHDLPAEMKATSQAQSTAWLVMAKEHGAEAGLGVLALLSLFWVWRMAKRSGLSPSLPSRSMPSGSLAWAGGHSPAVSPDEPLRPLGGGPMTVGEATEIDGVMVGHEVDERTVRVQQIAKQIGQMIKEDPAVAAGIVQHWLGEED